jgi:C-terminal peptidase prc
MKKFLAILFSTIFFISQQSVFAFTDVTSDTNYQSEITYLEEQGLLPTTFGDTFNPDKKATVEDLYSMMIAYAEVELPETEGDGEISPYIQKAIELNLLKENTNLKRVPKKREIIMKLFDTLGVGVNKFIKKENFPFTDLKSNGPFSPYAYKAYQLGVVESDNPKVVHAAKTMTRAEVADVLYKINKNGGTQSITIKINAGGSDQKDIDNEAYDVFLSVWDTIKNSYYYTDEIDETKMLYEAIKGVVGTLNDPYTSFTTPDETSDVAILESEYEGVGMSVEMIDDQVTVISPFKDSPAEKAGVLPKDIVTKVDGTSVDGMDLDTVVNMIKGENGTTVTLTIKRGTQTLSIPIVRGYIFYKTVTLDYLSKSGKYIAYINMLTFGEETLNEFRETAQQIYDRQKTKKDVLGIIIDLRNNPGGYLDTAINIGGFFFDEDKTMVILEDKNSEQTSYYAQYLGTVKEYETGSGLLSDFKVAVLVNKGSASASEILSGALQDYGKAKIIGETTFGKGCVQELSVYNDNSIFKLTVSKWLTPKGRDINKKGLTPDKTIVNSGTTDAQLEEAKKEF